MKIAVDSTCRVLDDISIRNAQRTGQQAAGKQLGRGNVFWKKGHADSACGEAGKVRVDKVI